MGKITKRIKEHVVNAVIAKWGFKEKSDALIEREKKWAADFLKNNLPKGFEKTAKLNPTWFPTMDHIWLKCGETVQAVLESRPHLRTITFDCIRVPAFIQNTLNTDGVKNPFLKEAMDLVKARDELKESVMMYLNSCSTTDKLVELYPEMKEFLPKDEVPVNAMMLPVQSFGDILRKYI